MASSENQIAGLVLMISELKFELQQVKAEVEELRAKHSEVDVSDTLSKRVGVLEGIVNNSPFLGGRRPTPEKMLDPVEAVRAFWSITPKQHAIMQLVIKGLTNVRIAKRLDVTEGAAKSYLRQVCDSLGVRGRDSLRDTYKPILDGAAAHEYKERTTIIKHWADKYGALSYEEATMDDPYFEAVCVMRYRKPRAVEGEKYEPFEIKAKN